MRRCTLTFASYYAMLHGNRPTVVLSGFVAAVVTLTGTVVVMVVATVVVVVAVIVVVVVVITRHAGSPLVLEITNFSCSSAARETRIAPNDACR